MGVCEENECGGSVPGEGAANAEIQFLACIHRQGFIAVRFTQAVHGTPDVSVSDGTEFSTKNGLLPGTGPVHHWLDGVQNLGDKRSWSLKRNDPIVVCLIHRLHPFLNSNYSRNKCGTNMTLFFLTWIINIIITA